MGQITDARARELLGLATERAALVQACRTCGLSATHNEIFDAHDEPLGVELEEIATLAQNLLDLRTVRNCDEATIERLGAELAQCKTLLEQARTENHDYRVACRPLLADSDAKVGS